MPSHLDRLNILLANDSVSFHSGKGGLTCVRVNNQHCSGEVYLLGAHVTAFEPTGHSPVLWMSKSSNFEEGKPIRGGVPLCFPWFGPNAMDSTFPAHGYARTKIWKPVAVGKTANGGSKLELETEIAPFLLRYSITFSDSLDLELQVTLPTEANQTATYEEALHTYLQVGSIHEVEIEGLENCHYLDKVGEIAQRVQSESAIRFRGETDRVYQNTRSTCVLSDKVMKRKIEVAKCDSDSTVIWNPWIDKCRRMADFGDDEWTGMVCIETANVQPNHVSLSPGQIHTTRARIAIVTDSDR
jgi:glucose-6-phosphate 1-epimerase